MTQKRQKIERDSLGRRKDRVKRREVQRMENLYYRDQLDPSEIAELLKRSVRTVRNHLGLDVKNIHDSQSVGEGIEVDLEEHHFRLIELARSTRENLFQVPASPSQVVEDYIYSTWNERVQPGIFPWLCSPHWHCLQQHLGETEIGQVFTLREELWRNYFKGCRELFLSIRGELSRATKLVMVSSREGPMFLLDGVPSGEPDPAMEYFGHLLIAAVVRRMEAMAPTEIGLHFDGGWSFQDHMARPSKLVKRKAMEGMTDLYWGESRVGHVSSAKAIVVQDSYCKIAERLQSGTEWSGLIRLYLELGRSPKDGELRRQQLLLLDERLTAAIRKGHCTECRI